MTPSDTMHPACLPRRGLLTAAMAGSTLLLGARAAAAATTWQAYTYLSSSAQAPVHGFEELFDRLRGQTAGALSINLHLGGSLPISASSITSTVAQDVMQFGTDGFFSGSVPIAGLLRLPMLLRTRAEFEKAEAIATPYIDHAYLRKGIIALGEYIYPLQTIWSRRKLTSLADIKGQKLRVTSVEMGEFVKKFGGIPLTLGTPEVPAALDRGVVDGVLTATSGAGLQWKDLLKYNYRFPVQFANAVIIVNKSAFDALPAAQKALLRKEVPATDTAVTDTMQTEEGTLTAKLQAEGLVVTPPKESDIKEAEARMAPYWSEWARARGPEAVEALAKIRAALGR